VMVVAAVAEAVQAAVAETTAALARVVGQTSQRAKADHAQRSSTNK
jgi:hypothetical protein